MKRTPEKLAEALEIFIKSGSANGDEPLRYECISLVKVFAAAPDLLAALEGVLHHDDGLKDQYKISPSLIRQVRAAIAKAKS